jgi:phytoene synthase
MAAALSRVGEIVRQHDPDRFFTALFAPSSKRETLWVLYAFNHELARANEVAREPAMALIRLQWWREVVEGARRRHEVAGPLGDALDAGELDPSDLDRLIEGREAEPPQSLDAWTSFIEGTAGALAVAAGRALGAVEMDGLRAFGSAYGAAGVLRNAALSGRSLGRIGPDLAEAGRAWLAEGRRHGVARRALAAALPAVIAARDLRRPAAIRARGAGDKLAVMLAAIGGRI